MNTLRNHPVSGNRSSNIELFRIITMLLIIAHHLVVNSGLTAIDGPVWANPLSTRSILLLIIGAWGKTGINCFIMITGYFMCRSRISMRKFLRLFFEIKFYEITVFLIFLAFGYETLTMKSVLFLLLPIREIHDNFEASFLVFYLFIPFINRLIDSLGEKEHRRLLILCLFLYTGLGTFHRITFHYVSWFFVLYLLAAYLRIYPKAIESRTPIWAVLTAVCMMTAAVSVAVTTWYGVKVGRVMDYYHYFVTDSNSFLPTVTGVSAFLLFKSLKVKQSRFINTVAASTFGVLCIHANSDAMRQWLWGDLLNVAGWYNSVYLPLFIPGAVAAVYVVCVLLDQLRIIWIEKPFLAWLDSKIQGRKVN